ncbi:MAG: nucleotidyltransferase domain-containing protein [Clostridia bacterium]|nr:nucleotidyltransferase domain-containing protein [Clostridia bacterium]
MEETKITKIVELLKEQLNCDAIVLFGSYARDTQRKDSDIDIAVKSKREILKTELFDITQKVEEITKIDVDLVDLKKISDSFRYEILMNGKTLYCEDEVQFDLYKLDMFREYLELNESRKSIIERVKNGGTIYGK